MSLSEARHRHSPDCRHDCPPFYSSNLNNVVTEMLSSAVDEINNYAASKTALVSDTSYHLYPARTGRLTHSAANH
jgi:hypothetical protein